MTTRETSTTKLPAVNERVRTRGPVVRVVIADDSPTVRVAMRELLSEDDGIEVVGVARDGEEVVDLVARLEPDLVTMDVAMPNLDGVEAIRRIMLRRPTPIVVLTGLPSEARDAAAFEAMAAGAVDVMPKPLGDKSFRDVSVRRRIIAHLKNMAKVAVVGRRPTSDRSVGEFDGTHASVIAVASSTGGPPVLTKVLGSLGASSPPVLLVQHMSDGFVEGFVRWLDNYIPISVVLAESGIRPEPGMVYVSPADRHLEVSPTGAIRVFDGPPVRFHRPSGEPLFTSVAGYYGERSIGVILTGMGRDGAESLMKIRQRGGLTIAQDPASCVVPGMPGAAIETGAARVVAQPGEIARTLAAIRYVARRA